MSIDLKNRSLSEIAIEAGCGLTNLRPGELGPDYAELEKKKVREGLDLLQLFEKAMEGCGKEDGHLEQEIHDAYWIVRKAFFVKRIAPGLLADKEEEQVIRRELEKLLSGYLERSERQRIKKKLEAFLKCRKLRLEEMMDCQNFFGDMVARMVIKP